MADDKEMTGEEAADAAETQQSNWTIKYVPLRTRTLARSNAQRAHKSVAQWLEWAVELAAHHQGQGATLPPIGGLPVPSVGQPPADSSNSAGQLAPELVALARLAVDLTPPGKDSAAMRTMRSVVKRRAMALLLEANHGQPVPTKRANKRLPAPKHPEDAAVDRRYAGPPESRDPR